MPGDTPVPATARSQAGPCHRLSASGGSSAPGSEIPRILATAGAICRISDDARCEPVGAGSQTGCPSIRDGFNTHTAIDWPVFVSPSQKLHKAKKEGDFRIAWWQVFCDVCSPEQLEQSKETISARLLGVSTHFCTPKALEHLWSFSGVGIPCMTGQASASGHPCRSVRVTLACLGVLRKSIHALRSLLPAASRQVCLATGNRVLSGGYRVRGMADERELGPDGVDTRPGPGVFGLKPPKSLGILSLENRNRQGHAATAPLLVPSFFMPHTT
jgi:hypothetical protein